MHPRPRRIALNLMECGEARMPVPARALPKVISISPATSARALRPRLPAPILPRQFRTFALSHSALPHSPMPEFEVTRITAVPEGEARGFTVAREEIVLCNVDGEIYALQGMCSHEELPLDGG